MQRSISEVHEECQAPVRLISRLLDVGVVLYIIREYAREMHFYPFETWIKLSSSFQLGMYIHTCKYVCVCVCMDT